MKSANATVVCMPYHTIPFMLTARRDVSMSSVVVERPGIVEREPASESSVSHLAVLLARTWTCKYDVTAY
jgi:hypothetical protein